MNDLGKDGRMFLLNQQNLGKFTAGGPDKVEMSPILSLSCAPAGQAVAAHSAKAAKARSNNAISIFPRGDAELPDG